jgi:hypothetical protein
MVGLMNCRKAKRASRLGVEVGRRGGPIENLGKQAAASPRPFWLSPFLLPPRRDTARLYCLFRIACAIGIAGLRFCASRNCRKYRSVYTPERHGSASRPSRLPNERSHYITPCAITITLAKLSIRQKDIDRYGASMFHLLIASMTWYQFELTGRRDSGRWHSTYVLEPPEW